MATQIKKVKRPALHVNRQAVVDTHVATHFPKSFVSLSIGAVVVTVLPPEFLSIASASTRTWRVSM